MFVCAGPLRGPVLARSPATEGVLCQNEHPQLTTNSNRSDCAAAKGWSKRMGVMSLKSERRCADCVPR